MTTFITRITIINLSSLYFVILKLFGDVTLQHSNVTKPTLLRLFVM